MPVIDGVERLCIWRVPMARIEEVVSTHLGPGRVRGNESGACFSRQVSMYLGRHIGGWSTTRIGRFYNGRHHTTVLHAVARIERLRLSDESLDALLDVLADDLSHEVKPAVANGQRRGWRDALVETVMARITSEIKATAALSNQGDVRSVISIEVPEDIVSSFGPDGPSQCRAALEGLAIRGTRSGLLSKEQVRRLLGFEMREVEEFYNDHVVSIPDKLDGLCTSGDGPFSGVHS